MQTTSQILSSLAVTLFLGFAEAGASEKAFLDAQNNVHLLTARGHYRQLTHDGRARSLTIAPDNKTVAWLVAHTWIAPGDEAAGSDELVIYRDGRRRSIRCAPFIRGYWFWQQGRQVAIDCGGRRFAGRDILYDTVTLAELAYVDQTEVRFEDRPEWSRGQD